MYMQTYGFGGLVLGFDWDGGMPLFSHMPRNGTPSRDNQYLQRRQQVPL